MLIDNELVLSDAQTVAAATVSSTNVIDTGVKGDARGNELFLRVIPTKIDGGNDFTVSVAVRSADSVSGGALVSPTTDVVFREVALTDGSATAIPTGVPIVEGRLPYGCKRYIDVLYTCGGTVGSGAVLTAFFSKEK